MTPLRREPASATVPAPASASSGAKPVAGAVAPVKGYGDAWLRFSPDARRLLAAIALSSFARQAFVVLRNLYLKELGHTEGAIGNVVSASSLGQVLVALPAIILMARLGFRRAMLAALALDGAAALTQAFSASYGTILVATATAGAAGSLFQNTGQPYVLVVTRPEERPYLFGLLFACMNLGGALGSTVAGGLAELFTGWTGSPLLGYRLCFAVNGLALLAAIPVVLSFRREGDPGDAAREPAERAGAASPGASPDPDASPVGAPPAGLLAALRLADPRRVLLLALPEVTIGLGAGLTIPFLQLYFRSTFDLGSFAIGAIYMLGQAGMALGYLGAPLLANRVGERRTIVLSQALSVLFLVELAFPHGLAFAVGAFVLRTTLMNLSAPVVSGYSLALAHPQDRRALHPILSMLRGLSWVVAGAAGGRLIESHGGDFSIAIACTAAIYVASAALGAALYRRLEVERAAAPG